MIHVLMVMILQHDQSFTEGLHEIREKEKKIISKKRINVLLEKRDILEITAVYDYN